MRKTIILGTVVGLLAGGCGSGAVDTCKKRAELACEFMFDCCNESERAALADIDGIVGDGLSGALVVDLRDFDKGSCKDAVRDACELETLEAQAAEEDGRIEYDRDALDECLAPLKEAVDACDATAYFGYSESGNEACQNIVTGLVPQGGECFAAFECANPGSSCEEPEQPDDPEEPAVAYLAGTCVSPAGENEPCGAGADPSQCAPDLYCDPLTDSCAPRTGLNQPCDTGVCQADLYCHFADQVCRAYAQEGEPCGGGTGDFCDFFKGLSCDEGTMRCVREDVVTVEYAYCQGD